MTEHVCKGESSVSFMLWLMHVISLHAAVRGAKSKLFRTIYARHFKYGPLLSI